MIIKNYKKLATSDLRKKALKIIDFGVSNCYAEKAIKKNIKIKNKILEIKNKKYNLKNYNNIYLIGFGKMSSSSAKEIEKIIPIKKGIIIDTKKINLKNKNIKVFRGTHPFPSRKNIKATLKILELTKTLNKNDLVIVIVSGGGSSLLCHPNMPFNKYKKIIKKILFSGKDIKQINKMRKKYSNIKAGKLGKEILPAKLINLYFSDVIGDDLKTIASGPTYIKEADNFLLLNNKVGVDAINKKAKQLGFKTKILTTKLKGEASKIGEKLLFNIKNKKNMCMICAGETTVKVKGKGRGGRNQELCLGALEKIKNMKNTILLSFASDGIDGTTNYAGAIIDCTTYEKIKKYKLKIKHYLQTNNTYDVFKKTNDLIFTGKTGINLMDFVVVLKK
jgi:glycerate-2-kinase